MNELAQTQDAVRKYWDEKPCGSDLSAKDLRSREYFLEIEQRRYEFEPHILTLLSWIDWRNKDVLEIGTGVGTDARKIIDLGARYTGINVDAGSVAATRNALNVFLLPGQVRQTSAISLPFESGSLDVVYSFGVLHHIPEVEKVVSEIRRVLKPGGELLVMLYNRSSINYHIEIMFLRKLVVRLLGIPGVVDIFSSLGFPRVKLERHVALRQASRGMSDDEWLSRNTDGPDNPYSRVYGKADAEKLFSGFTVRRHKVFFFDRRHWGFLGKMLPERIRRVLGGHWGWHRVLHLTKPA